MAHERQSLLAINQFPTPLRSKSISKWRRQRHTDEKNAHPQCAWQELPVLPNVKTLIPWTTVVSIFCCMPPYLIRTILGEICSSLRSCSLRQRVASRLIVQHPTVTQALALVHGGAAWRIKTTTTSTSPGQSATPMLEVMDTSSAAPAADGQRPH